MSHLIQFPAGRSLAIQSAVHRNLAKVAAESNPDTVRPKFNGAGCGYKKICAWCGSKIEPSDTVCWNCRGRIR